MSPIEGHLGTAGMDVFTVAQLKMAKAALGLSNAELAERLGVHKNTINAVENGKATQTTLIALQQVLEGAGVVFLLADAGLGEGVCLREPSATIEPIARTRRVPGE